MPQAIFYLRKGDYGHVDTVLNWVAVKELKLSYHNGYIHIYRVNNRVSPI